MEKIRYYWHSAMRWGDALMYDFTHNLWKAISTMLFVGLLAIIFGGMIYIAGWLLL